MKKQRGHYMPDMGGLIVILVLLGVGIGVLVTKAIPWIWAFVKPWLHVITA